MPLNHGELRADFEVVIAGSNIYNKQAGVLELPDYVGPLLDYFNHAAFDVPLEPVGGYDTNISRNFLEYNGSFPGYNASRCASICEEWTSRNFQNPSSASDGSVFLDDTFPVCSMFITYELRKADRPMGMVCEAFSSVWSPRYQTIHTIDAMIIRKVSVYRREDYQYPAICAISEHCKGDEWYTGGDCSGWGPEKCRKSPQ